MKNQQKGLETKNKILKVSRRLFYSRGLVETTSRMISEESGTNLGLLTYYFQGKTEIALQIYSDLRSEFDALIVENEPDLSDEDIFLLSSAIELYLCLTNNNFCRFYNQFTNDPKNRVMIQKHIMETLQRYSQDYSDDIRATLATLSISAIKPALVDYIIQHPNEVEPDIYLKYYIEQQLHYLSHNATDSQFYIDKLHSYYLNVADNFTPVMTKLHN